MKLLLDTHILLWAAVAPARLPDVAAEMIADPDHEAVFSAASIWEIAIKRSLGRDDFDVDPAVFRRSLLDNGYVELAASGEHAAAVDRLPPIHRDPFDRLLVAQAMVEGIILLTRDEAVALYPGPIRRV